MEDSGFAIPYGNWEIIENTENMKNAINILETVFAQKLDFPI